ncbi:hypothetical protein D043_0500B, partial [Vibrio parahaemolyticus EKP-021]
IKGQASKFSLFSPNVCSV